MQPAGGLCLAEGNKLRLPDLMATITANLELEPRTFSVFDTAIGQLLAKILFHVRRLLLFVSGLGFNRGLLVEKRIGSRLVLEAGRRAVSGEYASRSEGQQFGLDHVDQELVVTAGKVGSSDTAREQHVA